MSILVTGAGLVGCYFAREMTQRGHRVVLYEIAPNRDYVGRVAGDVPVVTGDVQDLPALVETVQGHGVDTIVHTVAVMGQKLDERPYTGLSVNIGGTVAVAEAARLTRVRRLVYASTFGVYNWGLPPTAPVNEDFPVAGNVFYSGSKVASERVVRAYGGKYGIEAVIVRFAVVYGWGHYAGGAAGGQVLHAALAAAMTGGPVRIDPALLSVTEYVYVKDVAQGVALACEKPVKNRAFNIGTGALSGPRDVGAAIERAFPGVEVQVGPAPPGQLALHRSQPLDLSRSRQELGYKPQFDLVQGIADFARELQRSQGALQKT